MIRNRQERRSENMRSVPDEVRSTLLLRTSLLSQPFEQRPLKILAALLDAIRPQPDSRSAHSFLKMSRESAENSSRGWTSNCSENRSAGLHRCLRSELLEWPRNERRRRASRDDKSRLHNLLRGHRRLSWRAMPAQRTILPPFAYHFG